MQAQKLSISLPNDLNHFVDEYMVSHACRSRSEVIQFALRKLQETELESQYRQANAEIDSDWDNTSGDGIDDETW